MLGVFTLQRHSQTNDQRMKKGGGYLYERDPSFLSFRRNQTNADKIVQSILTNLHKLIGMMKTRPHKL